VEASRQPMSVIIIGIGTADFRYHPACCAVCVYSAVHTGDADYSFLMHCDKSVINIHCPFVRSPLILDCTCMCA
jgi:hypothetical protein